MHSIPYDPARSSLLHPGLRPTVFTGRENLSDIRAVAAELSRLAYLHFENGGTEEAQLRAALGRVGGVSPALDSPKYFDAHDTGTQAFGVRLAINGADCAVVAFRGTEPDEICDLASDLEASLVPWTTGRVHAGFARAYKSVSKDIGDWLDNQAPGKALFTGHSLGAALALLAASDRDGATLVNFGCPLVGDAAFATLLAGKSTKLFVNCCDAVTRVPPPADDLYVVAGDVVYLDKNADEQPFDPQQIATDRHDAREAYLKDYAWRRGNVMLRDLADHAPINYVRAFF